MRVEFADQGNSIAIEEFVFYPDELHRGNPYNTTFSVFVTSGSFSGFGDCEYDIKEFRRFVFELQEMYDFKRNLVKFNDICYGSEILFTMDQLGHIEISGTVYADATQHSLTFHFDTDQSSFMPFISGLKKMIGNIHIPK